MILFVFEGEKREPLIFETLQRLYFKENANHIVCTYNNNIYSLYKEMKALDEGADIVALLRQVMHKRGEDTLDGFSSTSDFAEVFLFFDYDFQNKNLELKDINNQVSEMLAYFNEETENGKLYISYPMLEAIRYTKALPDACYYTYKVSRCDCRCFKEQVQRFSEYGSFDFITISEGLTKKNEDRVRENWRYLIDQNVKKANYICHGINAYPESKDAIMQAEIFNNQLNKYIIKEKGYSVAILCAFPLFIYEYKK